MTLVFSMLPIYLLANFHCLGMCGPLVATLSTHKHRYFYFIGRIVSFSLVGLLSAEVGVVLHSFLAKTYFMPFLSLLIGSLMLSISLSWFFALPLPSLLPATGHVKKASHMLSLLILKDTKEATFLFGFFSVFLPCGQTFIVFSKLALSASPILGLINGFLFSVLTSPALFLALFSFSYFQTKRRGILLLSGFTLLVAFQTLLRGLSDLGVISHFVLLKSPFHLVLF